MKIKHLPSGNISLILETKQELNYLYTLSNSSAYYAKENAEDLQVNLEGSEEVTAIGVDLFYGLRKIVEVVE